MEIDHLGEVMAVKYPGEQEVALFVPGSAEVALCSSEEWQAAKVLISQEGLHRLGDQADADELPIGQGLRDLLRTLGASVG